MNIEIKIKDKQITLTLKKGEEVVDEMNWKEERKLSQELLVNIDELISRNNIRRNEVKNVSVDSDMNDNFTTPRIAKVVANVFNYVNSRN